MLVSTKQEHVLLSWTKRSEQAKRENVVSEKVDISMQKKNSHQYPYTVEGWLFLCPSVRPYLGKCYFYARIKTTEGLFKNRGQFYNRSTIINHDYRVKIPVDNFLVT